jgi:hypothetical protein
MAQGRIASTPQPVRQAALPGVATFGLPSSSGLTAGTPPQLTPPMPASLPPLGPANISAPGVAPGTPPIDAGIAAPTSTGGGGGVVILQQSLANGTYAMGGPPASSPRGPFSAVDIARAFLEADTNRDGELSRAEAQRLSIPLGASFDDLDRNRDGVLSRFEFEDAFR